MQACRNGAGIEAVLDMPVVTGDMITADIEIHGGMITAYSEQGACIRSGNDSSSKVLINGGTICLDIKESWERSIAHIGMGKMIIQAPTDED